VGLTGGPLRASPATLLAKTRLAGALAGRLAVVGAVGGPLLGMNPVDGRAGPLPVGPLGWVMGLGAKGPGRIGDLVAAPVLLDLGSGLAPGPSAPGRLRNRTQRIQDITGAVGFDRQAGCAPLPGQSPYDLPVGRTEMGVGFHPAVAALLVLAQLPLAVVGPVDLLGGHRQPTRHRGRLVAAATQPAKHAVRPAIGGMLGGGQSRLGLLAVGGGPGQLAASIAGSLVELAA